MGVEIRFDIDDTEVTQWLNDSIDKMRDFKPLLRKFQVQMIRSFSLNFVREGRPNRWAKLRPNTIASRRAGSSRVLQDTGRLRMSAIARRAPGNITKMSPNVLRMGSSVPYAAFHEFGTRPYTIRPKRRKFLSFMTADGGRVFAKVVRHPGLRPRPFVLIQDEDLDVMEQLAADYAEGD